MKNSTHLKNIFQKNICKKNFALLLFIFSFSFAKAQYVTIPDANFRAWLINNGYAGCMVGNTLDTTCSAVVNANEIDCSAQNISDLTGIEYFDALTYLDCSNNPITSLPSLPVSLGWLDCSTGLLTALPVLPVSLTTLKCYNNQLMNLPMLPNTLYNMDCNTNQLTSLPALPNSLTWLHCGHNQLSSLPQLPSQLTVLICKENLLSGLPTLPSILYDLDCHHNPLNSLPFLPNFLTSIDCRENQLTNLPNVPDSLTFLDCRDNSILSIPTVPSTLLYLLCSHNQLTTIPALSNVLRTLWCEANQLTSLPSLPASLDQLLCAANQLTTLPVLPDSLGILDCGNNLLTSIPQLPESLNSFSCNYNQLTSIPSLPDSLMSFYCNDNHLTSLPNLPNSLHYIFCNNNQLTSLPELPDSLTIFYCYNNPNLNCFPQLKKIANFMFFSCGITCLPNYGNVGNSNPSLNSIPLCSIFNPNGCSSFWNISGKSYYDSNNNCSFDSADAGQVNSHISLYENGILQQQAFTGGEGYYSFQIPNTGNYTTEIDTTSLPFDVVCPLGLNYNDVVSTTDTLYDRNFSMQCKPGFDVGVLSIQGCVFRPVHQTVVNIHAGDISNFYGAHCAAGIAGSVITVLSGPASYVSPAPGAITPDVVSGDSIIYNIADFGTVDFYNAFNIIVVTDTFAVIGSHICATVLVLPMAGDNDLSNNKLSHCFTVVSSYDPNDKQVDPVSYIDIAGDRWLTYTINFQNTGTAEAEHIYIADTLDSNLDLSTFQLLTYSHHVIAQILAGGIVKFNFPNINLPDSNSNEPASHGYVQYKIKFKSGINLWSQVRNTAYIYFDFNSPVVTNTVSTTITDATGINQSVTGQNEMNIYPNPSKGEFTLSFSNHTGEKAFVKIYNILSESVFEKRFTVSSSLTFNHSEINLQKGMYVVEVIFENYSEKKKLMVE